MMNIRSIKEALKRKPRSLVCDNCRCEFDAVVVEEDGLEAGMECALPAELYSAVGDGCPGTLRIAPR